MLKNRFSGPGLDGKRVSVKDAPMDYEAIAAMFLRPTGTEPEAPVVANTPARRLRDAAEEIATIGWWSPEAASEMRSLGHGFFDGYVWGRAASLGADVSPSVVIAAFGVFNSALLVPVLEAAKQVSSRADILAAREKGATAGLRAVMDPSMEPVVGETADQLLDVTLSIEPGTRVLFGALQSLPVPLDPFGRLWRAAELVREHRGDTHLAASVAAGLSMAEMNVLTELWLGYRVGEYSATRGFDEAALGQAIENLGRRGWVASGAITAAGRAFRDQLELATDQGQSALVQAFGSGLSVLEMSLRALSATVLRAEAAPADPRKRAAG